MKVRHRPVINSGHRQTELYVCKLSYMCPTVSLMLLSLAVGKINDASSGSDRLQCCRRQQKINDRQLCSHVCAQEEKYTRHCCLVGKRNYLKYAMYVPCLIMHPRHPGMHVAIDS